MKQKIFIILLLFVTFFIQSNCFSGQFDFIYEIDESPENWAPIIDEGLEDNTNFWRIINDNIVDKQDSDLNQMIWVYHNDTDITGPNSKENKAVVYTRIIINYFLALVWFVALIILIYWFYMMFGSSHEEWMKKAKKYIVWAVIAIFVIWVSRFIISWFMSIFLQAS